MKIFLINLDRSLDRLAVVDTELKHVGIDYERVSAVDGAKLSPDELKSNVSRFHTYRCMGRRMRLSEIGCALSHLEVYKIGLAKKLAYWAVLEDDAIVDGESWRRAVQTVEQANDPEVPTVWLLHGRSDVEDPGQPSVVRLLGHQRNVMNTWGAEGYVLNAAAARRLLALAWPVHYCSDVWSTYCRKGIDVRVVFPTAVRERPGSGQTSTVLSKTGHGRLWIWYGHFVKFRYVVCFWLDIFTYRLGRFLGLIRA